MARPKSDSSPISLNEAELLCSYAEEQGEMATAGAIRFLLGSVLSDKSGTGAAISETEWPSSWSEVDYKVYPRFRTMRLNRGADVDGVQLGLRDVLLRRSSCRKFGSASVSTDDLAAALNASCMDRKEFPHPSRAFPSAGGFYSMEVYLVADRVSGCSPGVYHYSPKEHCLHVLFQSEREVDRIKRSIRQEVGTPAAYFVLTSRFGQHLDKYGLRGLRFALLELGAGAQALDLALTSTGLETLWLGGFADDTVSEVVGVKVVQEFEVPLIVLALGHSAD